LLPIEGLSLRAAYAKQGGTVLQGCDIPAGVVPQTQWFTVPFRRLTELQRVPGNSAQGVADYCAANTGGIGASLPQPDPYDPNDSKLQVMADFGAGHGSPFNLSTATPYANLSHQAWGKSTPNLGDHPPENWYVLESKQRPWSWHPFVDKLSGGNIAWGFNGEVPGPVFRSKYGSPDFVRIVNNLPAQPIDGISGLGFGTPFITTHLHNMHSPSESDGNPLYWNYPGHFWDYHHPNLLAGVNKAAAGQIPAEFANPASLNGGTVLGDIREALGTLWYHDHKLDFTSQNVYAGQAGFKIMYDILDTGDETTGLRLPTGPNFEFDVPLVFHDRAFDTNGVDYFPLVCFDGAIGHDYTVNGKVRPTMDVEPRSYRFRLLDMGPSRFYWWFLQDDRGNNLPYTVIANDGNLFPAAVGNWTQGLKHAVAERWDIVIDFSKFAGKTLYLVNRAEQVDGRSPTGNLLTPGDRILQFKVGRKLSNAAFKDNSAAANGGLPNGYPLRPMRDKQEMLSLVTKPRQTWTFKRAGGGWAVHGDPTNININTGDQFDRFATPYQIPEGTAENWLIVNGGGSWSHPVHIHYEEHQYLSYNGVVPSPIADPTEFVRKDVIRLDPNAQVDIVMQFRDFKGIYPMHCHNVVHEDHAMMIMWQIA
jgi:FtsP/CotA-like multicopper oxidase with cupredoxin domain